MGTYNSDWALTQNGQNPARRPKNSPPSSQTATYQKTEVIQSYLRIWGTYDPIELGPSEPKKWGFHRCSLKKCRNLGKKLPPAATPRPALQRVNTKMLPIGCPVMIVTKNLDHFRKKNDFGPKNCIFLRYTYETPIFLAQTDPTQLNHKSPIS